MKLFPGTSWTDLATAAVACISVAGVWWTFWPGHREKLREQREQRLQRLLELHVQLQEIRRWAGTRYDKDIHRSEWYNAGWAVNPFPWVYVENFNRLVLARDYRRELTEALVRLEDSARQFHDMLSEQIEYLSRAPKDIGSRWSPVVAAAEAKGSKLSVEELQKIEGLTDEDRRWLQDLYRRNKDIHVRGIGGPGEAGLHEACRAATEQLVQARTELQTGRDTCWRWVGHGMAALFVALGLLFLIDFGWSLADARHHPRRSMEPAQARSDSRIDLKPASSSAAEHDKPKGMSPRDSTRQTK